jgi:hypothetical protein
LQPTTANDNVTKKSSERIIAYTFFINMSSFQIFLTLNVKPQPCDRRRWNTYALFLPCQDNFLNI